MINVEQIASDDIEKEELQQLKRHTHSFINFF